MTEIPKEVTTPLIDILLDHNEVGDMPKTSHRHLTAMLIEIQSGKITGDKAHRWLGYVQGCMVMRGWLDVDQERDRTRPFFADIVESSKGRTADFDSANVGSSPASTASDNESNYALLAGFTLGKIYSLQEQIEEAIKETLDKYNRILIGGQEKKDGAEGR